MFFADLCADFVQHIQYERNLAKKTVSGYSAWLSLYRQWADTAGLGLNVEDRFETPVLRRYLYSLSARKLRPRTIHNALMPLRALGDYCVKFDLLTINPAHALTLPKKDAADRQVATREELEALLGACERQADPRRVALSRAMMAVLVFCGVRFQELLDLKVGHVSLSDKTLLIAHGKGDKSRLLYPPQPCLDTLAAWIDVRDEMGCKHDWLFAYDKGRRMGEVGTRQMIDQLQAIAGLTRRKVLPHSIRRAYATRCLAAGMDVRSLQASLGHSEVSTTMLYAYHRDRPAETMREFAGLPTPTPSGGSSKADMGCRMRRSVGR